jgi:aspartyl-tRNA(Asn)/glutamyl-tRNA(Gln) amidotransferase subunit A
MTQWVDLAMVGPITRTVRDAAIYLDAVVGYHPADPASLPHPGISFHALLERIPKKLMVAFHPDFGHAVDPEVRRVTTDAARIFADLGHEVTVLDEPVIETCHAWRTISTAQTFANLADYLKDHREEYGRAFLASVESASGITWRDYGNAYRVRTQFNEWLRSIFDRYDLLLTPTLPTAAFNASGPPPAEIDGRRVEDVMHALTFTYPFNLSGHPAASIRAGLTNEGLPCGLQIIAERHRDDLVLQAAYAYEHARSSHDQWPQFAHPKHGSKTSGDENLKR